MNDRRHFLKKALTGGAVLLSQPLFSQPLLRAMEGVVRPWEYVADDPWLEAADIIARIKPPVFPNKDFDITKYGAVGDGKTLCTEAFAKAIAACNGAGGGRVVVPKGDYLTGAIHLKSNVNLHVTAGGTIKFSRDPK